MDFRHYILKDGEMVEANLITWARWLKDIDNRRVAETIVESARVSTVCLPVNLGFGGRPLYFETMVFGGALDQETDRYETLEEAMLGHERMVARVKEGKVE